MESKEAADVTTIGDVVVVTPGIGLSLALHKGLALRLARAAGSVVVDPAGTLCAQFYQAGDRVINPYDERHRAWSVSGSVVEHEEGANMSLGHPVMTIEQYYDELNRHDWYCGFSDDYSVQSRGEENYVRLLEIANQHGADYLGLIGAFQKHYFSGEPWNTPKHDKPARPINGVLVLPSVPTVSAEIAAVRTNKLED
ncbi:TPA: type IV secretion system DNA-binding domain-containing protein [Burkholderia cenocepacia]|uniref:Type IV secretion system DNA-binding domain-containing protein n=1 Tax=Burkholderia vietnamiensis TaxID=60552 RepID=A0ABS1AXI7_BURVI|nr:type IV secretion system DNA-binding domain-containing protein [Burkholderia vietnamiensis]MBJ9688874.1 type IV secretion system DNA-binding domain-containing protein [Burkholderia vietnamiensis]